MSSYIKKIKPKSKVKLVERSDLLSAILRLASKIRTPYSFYKACRLSYKALLTILSTYSKYIYNY